jgi:subtilisin family serine protease
MDTNKIRSMHGRPRTVLMRSRRWFAYLFMSMIVVACGPYVCRAQANSASERQYIVEFSGSGLPSDLSTRIAALGGVVVDTVPQLKFAVVRNMTIAAADALRRQSDVSDVTDDEMTAAVAAMRRPAGGASRSTPSSSLLNPTLAASYPLQWNMRAVRADAAWNAGLTGDSNVRVAMIDTGLDPSHPDLAGRIDWSRSISYCPGEDAVIAQEFPGYPAWSDLDGHGTHGGAIVSSNAHTVAGIASQTTLMAVKWDGVVPCGMSGILRGVVYSADNGADVINMSLARVAPYPKSGQKGLFHYTLLVVRYALQRGVSAVVVAAANDAEDLDHNGNDFQWLCDVPGVLCVSATGPTDTGPYYEGPFVNVDASAFYTNYGSSAIDVAAPGGNLLFDETGNNIVGEGWLWSSCSTTDREIGPSGELVPGYCTRNGTLVGPWLGTSFAAPHVSGLAALIVSRIGPGHPEQVRSIIESSADDLGRPGMDPYYGRGRINVARALGVQ